MLQRFFYTLCLALYSLFFEKYLIREFVVDKQNFYVVCHRHFSEKIVKIELIKIFSDTRLLKKFSREDALRIGFVGFGKIFILDKIDMTKPANQIEKIFAEFVEQFNQKNSK